MLLLHLLNALVDVAAGLQQIIVRLVHLILREVHARLREIEPVLDGRLLGVGGLGELLGELLDAFRSARQGLLRIVQALLDLARLRTERWRVRLEVPQCGGEGEIELVIGGLHGRLCERLLLGRVGKARQTLRRKEGVLVDDRHGALGRCGRGGRRSRGCAERDRRCMGRPQSVAGGREQHDQHGRGDLLQLAHAAYDATPLRGGGRGWFTRCGRRVLLGVGLRSSVLDAEALLDPAGHTADHDFHGQP